MGFFRRFMDKLLGRRSSVRDDTSRNLRKPLLQQPISPEQYTITNLTVTPHSNSRTSVSEKKRVNNIIFFCLQIRA